MTDPEGRKDFAAALVSLAVLVLLGLALALVFHVALP